MRLSRVVRLPGRLARGQSGTTLIEAMVALALLGIIAVAFLSGLATTVKATVIADEQATAGSLARSQMEWVKGSAYVYDASSYSAAAIPDGEDYDGYSAAIAAAPLNNPDDGIQKITVAVSRNSKEVARLVAYKVDR